MNFATRSNESRFYTDARTAKLVITRRFAHPVQLCRQTCVLTKHDGQMQYICARNAYVHVVYVSYNNDQLVINMSDGEPQ